MLRKAAQAHWMRVVFSQSPAQEKAPVDADLRNHHFSFQAADDGDGSQHFHGYAKALELGAHLMIDSGDSRIHSLRMVRVNLQH